MFVFAHLGIGSLLVRPWTQGLRRRWVLLGTLLPDLIDKPLYYGLSWITGKHGAELGLFSGTRTFGHTGLFLILLALASFSRRSLVLAALALGAASHLLLDHLSDTVGLSGGRSAGNIKGLLWPVLGIQFPVMPFKDATEHASVGGRPGLLAVEAFGAFLLLWDWWKKRHKNEILAEVQRDRRLRHLRKAKRKSRASEKPAPPPA